MLGFTSNDLEDEQRQKNQSGSICPDRAEVARDTVFSWCGGRKEGRGGKGDVLMKESSILSLQQFVFLPTDALPLTCRALPPTTAVCFRKTHN